MPFNIDAALGKLSGAVTARAHALTRLPGFRDEGHILPQGALTRVVNEVSDAVVGLGPIEFLAQGTLLEDARDYLPSATDMNHLNALAGTSSGQASA